MNIHIENLVINQSDEQNEELDKLRKANAHKDCNLEQLRTVLEAQTKARLKAENATKAMEHRLTDLKVEYATLRELDAQKSNTIAVMQKTGLAVNRKSLDDMQFDALNKPPAPGQYWQKHKAHYIGTVPALGGSKAYHLLEDSTEHGTACPVGRLDSLPTVFEVFFAQQTNPDAYGGPYWTKNEASDGKILIVGGKTVYRRADGAKYNAIFVKRIPLE